MPKPFRFCPSCATGLEEAGEKEERECPSCGRIWYVNAAPTAGAAIVKDGRVIITRRGSEPEKGKLDIPGGFLEPGEAPIDGLRREIREELGIEIDVSMDDCLQMVPHEYGEDGEWVLAIGFKARLVSGDPKPASDVTEALWATKEELDELDFAWDHDRDLARKALEAAELDP